MQKLVGIFFYSLVLYSAYGQTNTKTSAYLQVQFNTTTTDITKGNNPWGLGLDMQLFINNRTQFKPCFELGTAAYLEDDKVGRSFNNIFIERVGSMTNLFAGVAWQPCKQFSFSFTGGPSLINGNFLTGIKPSMGFYFGPHKKWNTALSYITIFNRYKPSSQNFSSVSLGTGIKLF
jgi:hypothetical protein